MPERGCAQLQGRKLSGQAPANAVLVKLSRSTTQKLTLTRLMRNQTTAQPSTNRRNCGCVKFNLKSKPRAGIDRRQHDPSRTY